MTTANSIGWRDLPESRPRFNITFRGVHPYAELAHYVERRAMSMAAGAVASVSVLVATTKRQGQVAVYVIAFTPEGPITSVACDADPLLAARDAFDASLVRCTRRSRRISRVEPRALSQAS
jgi:hypothetical protein